MIMEFDLLASQLTVLTDGSTYKMLLVTMFVNATMTTEVPLTEEEHMYVDWISVYNTCTPNAQ